MLLSCIHYWEKRKPTPTLGIFVISHTSSFLASYDMAVYNMMTRGCSRQKYYIPRRNSTKLGLPKRHEIGLYKIRMLWIGTKNFTAKLRRYKFFGIEASCLSRKAQMVTRVCLQSETHAKYSKRLQVGWQFHSLSCRSYHERKHWLTWHSPQSTITAQLTTPIRKEHVSCQYLYHITTSTLYHNLAE